MNRNLATRNKPSYKVYGFWSIIVLLTLVFISFVIVKFVQSRSDLDMDDLSNLSYREVLSVEAKPYYVFIYSKFGVTEDESDLERIEELRPTIENYLNRVKNDKELPKLYGMIVENNYGVNDAILISGVDPSNLLNKVNVEDFRINRSDVPMLIKVSGKTVTEVLLKEIDIKEALDPKPNQ